MTGSIGQCNVVVGKKFLTVVKEKDHARSDIYY